MLVEYTQEFWDDRYRKRDRPLLTMAQAKQQNHNWGHDWFLARHCLRLR